MVQVELFLITLLLHQALANAQVFRDTRFDLSESCTKLEGSWSGNQPVQSSRLTQTHESVNGFELRIRRTSDNIMVSGWYEPGKKYTVILTNRMQMVGFRNAILWLTKAAEKPGMEQQMEMKYGTETSSEALLNGHLGRWINLPSGIATPLNPSGSWTQRIGITQERSGCSGITVERQSGMRSLITQLVVNWQAPSSSTMAQKMNDNLPCVTIHASVRTGGGIGSIYSDEGGLVKTLCPTSSRPPSAVLPAEIVHSSQQNGDEQKHAMPENVIKYAQSNPLPSDSMQPEDCCACGSASYKLTFKGLWTKKTHPRDWPDHNPGLLHWTNLIGASHMPSYRIYQHGEPASAGVQAVCAYGDTTVVKQSLGLAASNVGAFSGVPTGTQRGSIGIGPLHSIISAPGMWSEETLNETRTTVIGVNRTHPLVSFLTMLGPSPNWCAGLSSQSVCQADCTWADQLEIDLYPWDAGVRHGDTYIPKNADRKDVPDPIRYITRDWMPNHPFTPNLPVARVILQRILPKVSWQCTDQLDDDIELFRSDGTTFRAGDSSNVTSNEMVKSATSGGSSADASGSFAKKSRNKGSGGGGITSLGEGNPLADPSLAQMATFLCITESWSPWSACSVTCGVGHRQRQRTMIVNKKNELCQHVPLNEQEACEGRKRTCDFSAQCSLLPWTSWTPCNATCDSRKGQQTRRRYLARPSEITVCQHLFKSQMESRTGLVVESGICGPADTECDPVTICGEGRKDGVPCGKKMLAFHYSAVQHDCVPFDYRGCKGGRNRFPTREACRETCIGAVEALPAWRRERMALLQYQTSQTYSDKGKGSMRQKLEPAKACRLPMDAGYQCKDGSGKPESQWYFCRRTHRCREFVFLGCGGNENLFSNFTECMASCMPTEVEKSRQLAKVRAVVSETSSNTSSGDQRPSEESDVTETELLRIDDVWGPGQDCQLTQWGGWGPCSAKCHWESGHQWRWRHIMKPARHGGKPCGILFDQHSCHGGPC